MPAAGAGPGRRSRAAAGLDVYAPGHPCGLGPRFGDGPGLLAAAAPQFAGVQSFLDVGTGVGLLAIAAARTWPAAAVTGIDIWEPALEMAAGNITAAGLADRVTVRRADVTSLDEVGSYDCAWFPTFFVREPVLDAAVPRLVRALRPGGWLVLGRMAPPPDPVAQAASALRTIRGGGADFATPRLVSALEAAGCAERRGPAPHRPGPDGIHRRPAPR